MIMRHRIWGSGCKWKTEKVGWLMAVLLCTALGSLAGETGAEESASKNVSEPNTGQKEDKAQRQATINQRIQVIGSREIAEKTPGSAHYIGREELEKQAYSDIHRILREVPGVNIQEEEGMGLRPNIGIRGTGVERSSKITLLEDGVLIAPAPYTAPSAYYFPTAGRMEAVELLKGPSAIKQGPYTNGGALNLISSSIPNRFNARLNGEGGSHGTGRFKGSFGDSTERTGWLVETYQLQTDGFKELDNGGDTGVDLEDYMAKLRFNSTPEANIYQSLELKLGKTTQFGDETYLGLTEADYRQTPYRRYAASAEDFIDTDHEQAQIRYFVKPAARYDVTTTIYNNDFARNWHKLESVNGIGNQNVLTRPDEFQGELAILRGEQDSQPGALTVRNNRREYYSRGIQSVLNIKAETGSAQHELELGIRYHEDEEDRFQDDERYQMTAGRLTLTERGAPGSQTNRVSDAEAFSFYLQDTIELGGWTLRPGLRHERIDYTREDYSTADPQRALGPTRVRQNEVSVWLPGLGGDYRLSNHDRVFLGIYRGFSPPGAGVNEDTEEERSLNTELGFRHVQSHFRAELIGFHNDYDNLLGTETVSGGGGSPGDLFNGGEVRISGIEASLAYDFGQRVGGDYAIPFSATYTYTDTEFKSSFESSFADWSPSVVAGDELPYLPQQQLTLNLGITQSRWGVHGVVSHVGEMRSNAGQGPIPSDQLIEKRTLLDLSADVLLFGRYKLYTHIRNLTDEDYLVARRPYGVRPGLNRSILFGISATF